jgi:hypothetical protein
VGEREREGLGQLSWGREQPRHIADGLAAVAGGGAGVCVARCAVADMGDPDELSEFFGVHFALSCLALPHSPNGLFLCARDCGF